MKVSQWLCSSQQFADTDLDSVADPDAGTEALFSASVSVITGVVMLPLDLLGSRGLVSVTAVLAIGDPRPLEADGTGDGKTAAGGATGRDNGKPTPAPRDKETRREAFNRMDARPAPAVVLLLAGA